MRCIIDINCTNLKRSYQFFRDVVGLDTGMYVAPGRPQPIANGSLGDALRNADGSDYTGAEMEFAANLLVPRHDWRNPIDLLEWSLPRPYGRAYESPRNLGISRIALEVDDINAAQRKLATATNGAVSAVESWDMGEFGQKKIAIFRDPDGVLLELIEQPQPAASGLD